MKSKINNISIGKVSHNNSGRSYFNVDDVYNLEIINTIQFLQTGTNNQTTTRDCFTFDLVRYDYSNCYVTLVDDNGFNFVDHVAMASFTTKGIFKIDVNRKVNWKSSYIEFPINDNNHEFLFIVEWGKKYLIDDNKLSYNYLKISISDSDLNNCSFAYRLSNLIDKLPNNAKLKGLIDIDNRGYFVTLKSNNSYFNKVPSVLFSNNSFWTVDSGNKPPLPSDTGYLGEFRNFKKDIFIINDIDVDFFNSYIYSLNSINLILVY